MQGAIGRVVTLDLNGDAWAEVHGERWKVRLVAAEVQGSAAGLEPGQRVKVLATHGLTLDVQRLDEAKP